MKKRELSIFKAGFLVLATAIFAGCPGGGEEQPISGYEKINLVITVYEGESRLTGVHPAFFHAEVFDLNDGRLIEIEQDITLVQGRETVTYTLESPAQTIDASTLYTYVQIGENGIADGAVDSYTESEDGKALIVNLVYDLNNPQLGSVWRRMFETPGTGEQRTLLASATRTGERSVRREGRSGGTRGREQAPRSLGAGIANI